MSFLSASDGGVVMNAGMVDGPCGAPPPPSKDNGKGTVGDAYAELEGEDGVVDVGGEVEIEDYWIEPITPPAPAPVVKKRSKGKGKSKNKKAVPMPSVHYPFPMSAEDGGGVGTPSSPREREREKERERERMVTVSLRAVRLNTAANVGGQWMQSGGVRGIVREDS
ncbi:hypothetical protein B0H17DRAFT_1208516 [Mycena rosella]|uniref:Uncharacterized protein n=1 Tax=Mycena rosella TaxID=1033263 RepID=A0AAD7D0N5_MYCRO|nr:hypothetical protein B0H17DRAFT_1208516 [Mycena rosella]